MRSNHAMESGTGLGYYGEDCFSGGDVITRLCDFDLLVLNVYSFGTNVKYSAKNSLFDNKFLF